MMRFPALKARALRLRESVIARLLLTLVLALGAVGTFQYFVVGGRIEDDLIREHAAVHAADTRALASWSWRRTAPSSPRRPPARSGRTAPIRSCAGSRARACP
jgi:hypothetical protein